MTAGRAALVLLMDSYLRGLLDPLITLLEIHKLMYFMQETGEKLRLKYVKAPYGSYAENLRHVFNEIGGYYISGYADGGDDPEKQLTLVPSAIEDANVFLLDHADTLQRIGQVSKLVKCFESAFGLELLATAHWVAKRNRCATVDDVVRHVHNWVIANAGRFRLGKSALQSTCWRTKAGSVTLRVNVRYSCFVTIVLVNRKTI